MPADSVRSLAGVNQHGLRDHNERLILSMIQRQGPLPGSEIARAAGLSPQTVSVILRQLEQDGLLRKEAPIRGAVGKPRVPMALDPDGVLSFGFKIGRRTADVILCDFVGKVRDRRQLAYRYPAPEPVFGFFRESVAAILEAMPATAARRVTGIGVAKPFELWNWHRSVGAPEAALAAWREVEFADEIARFTGLPVFVENDATAACRAELIYGRGRLFRDFAYLYVGAFVGGGLVLNHSIYEGAMGNAGAFGSLPSSAPSRASPTLIDTASLYLLEAAIEATGQSAAQLWDLPLDWSGVGAEVAGWIAATAPALAEAARTISAVLDVEAVLIDGFMPGAVRAALVAEVERASDALDHAGLIRPVIAAGEAGFEARALGAALKPVAAQYMLNAYPLSTGA